MNPALSCLSLLPTPRSTCCYIQLNKELCDSSTPVFFWYIFTFVASYGLWDSELEKCLSYDILQLCSYSSAIPCLWYLSHLIENEELYFRFWVNTNTGARIIIMMRTRISAGVGLMVSAAWALYSAPQEISTGPSGPLWYPEPTLLKPYQATWYFALTTEIPLEYKNTAKE